MDTLHNVTFRMCLGVGLVCAVYSAVFFVFASYDTVVPAIVLLGLALAFAMVAAVINRQ